MTERYCELLHVWEDVRVNWIHLWLIRNLETGNKEVNPTCLLQCIMGDVVHIVVNVYFVYM